MNLRVIPQCVAALALGALGAAAADLAVIDLHNRTAEEVLPVIRPLAGNAALSGTGYQLFVRGETADVARIREVLATLDRAPQQFKISVRYAASPQSRETNLAGAATIGRGTEVVASGRTSLSTAGDSSISSVRVLEGNGAHISTGQSVPVIGAVFLGPTRKNRGATVGLATDYREVASGFDIFPRVNGDRVVLEIATQQQRMSDSASGTTTTQRTSTTVSGKLGEWIELGGVTDTSSEQHSAAGIAGGSLRTATQSDQRSIAVKVEKGD